MDEYSQRLLDSLCREVEPWLRRSFDRVAASLDVSDRVDPIARDEVVARAAASVLARLELLLSSDVTEQRTNPLQLLREATTPVTDELRRIGARPIERDEFHVRSFPRDDYGLCPATWSDIDTSLAEVGLEWGAWKAATTLARRRM